MFFVVFALPFVSFTQGIDFRLGKSAHSVAHLQSQLYDKNDRYRTECGKGEYLNLCAECVFGDTEKEDDFGTDSCGVCGGLETCRDQCTDPMGDLDGEPDEDKGCTKLISMTPNILDLAESPNGTVCIFGEGINPESLESVECSLKKDDTSVVDIPGAVMQNKVELEFPLPTEGNYDLYCNTSVGVEFRKNAVVVNTNSLLPMTTDKATILTWTENELTVTVSKMAGPSDVICFGRNEKGNLVYKEWSNAIEGNSLSSFVICPRAIVVKPGEIEFGVAYSEKAISTAKTVKVTGVAVSPNPVRAIFKPEVPEVVVYFDQNLDERKLDGCAAIFKPDSLSIFGRDPVCTAVANEIHVTLNDESALASTNLEFTDNVTTKFSEVAVEGSVRIDFAEAKEKPPLRLEGVEKICPGETTEVKVEGNHVGTPIWELNVTPKNLSMNEISPGQRQRMNLILWSANRSSRAFPRSLRLNSTQLQSGMKYQVRATARDHKGSDRQASIEVKIAGRDESWVELRGPDQLDVRAEAVYEAVVRACTKPINPDKFLWEVKNSKGDMIETSFHNGPKLHLGAGSLQPNDQYEVRVQAMEGDNILGTSALTVKTMMRNFELHLPEISMVVGTGQTLEVDASRAIDINSKLLKFKWNCKKGYCFLPGSEKTPLSKLETFSQPLLRLPPKSLAIGRYQFEVEAVMGDDKTKADLEVNVISGQPPYFSRLSASNLDPGRDLSVKVDVSEVRGLCSFHWESAPVIGYAYISINQSKTVVEGSPTGPEKRTLNLTIPRTMLSAGGKTRLKVVADCGRLSQSHLEFQLYLPDRFPELSLQVDPLKGNALETRFKYKALFNETDTKYLLHYGVEEQGVARYFSSGYNKEFETFLGQGSYRTLLKVCRTIFDCMTIFGPEVSTSAPTKIDDETLLKMVSRYKDLLTCTSFGEAKNFLELIVPAIKQTDEKKYDYFSTEIQKVIMERIQIYSERLKTEKVRLEDSVWLLDAATNALTLLANNEEAMTVVLQFRDLIHQTNQKVTEKKMENKVSANLPAEPRRNPVTEIYSRKKRRSPFPKHKIENPETKIYSHKKRSSPLVKDENVEEAVKVILKLSSNLPNITNDTERIAQEKILLLNTIAMYAAQFCNNTDQGAMKEADSGNGFCTIGSTRFNTDQLNKKLSFPQCNKACPNNTGQVVVNKPENTKMSEGFCLATAYLKDDILSDVSKHTQNISIRIGPIFWLDMLLFSNSVVNVLSDYSFLIPSNSTYSTSNEINKNIPIVARGTVSLYMPIWNQQKPEGTVLKCSRYENGTWNTTACRKNRENQSNLICTCPYPGYFSVFAVYENQTIFQSNGTITPTVPLLTTKTLVTYPATTPTVSMPTTTVASLSTTTAQIKNSSVTKSPSTQPITVSTVQQPVKNSTIGVTQQVVLTTPRTTGKTVLTTKPTGVTQISNSSSTTLATSINNLTTKSPVTPFNSSVNKPTVLSNPKDETPTVQLIQYKYLASFKINEDFSKKVEKNKDQFLTNLNNQLKSSLNITLPSNVEREKGMIKVTMKIEEKKLKEQSHNIALLAKMLKNGTLALKGLDGEVLSVPTQDLQLVESGKSVSSATTAFISVIFVFLLLLIGALITAVYLRNSRDQRCTRISQDVQDDPPVPKYLRLHDSVSLGSSGPSSPLGNDMESSLAVVTRPRGRGYNTMEQFSNLPGNI